MNTLNLKLSCAAIALNRTENGDRPFGVVALNFVSGEVPSEIQLLPAGKVEGRDGRWWDNDKPDDIVAAFVANDGPLLIDYEHASELNWDNDAVPAAGWINGIENRSGEIWATVEWTEKAEGMIKAKEYRFISPVFYYNYETQLILEIVSAGLTNQPNLKLTALNKKRGSKPVQQNEEPLAMNKEEYKALCRKLGLKDDASIDSVMAAIAANSANATPDLDQFVPKADYDALKERAANAEKAIKDGEEKALNTQIDELVDDAIKGGKIQPSSKDFYVAACKQDGGIARFKQHIGVTDKSPLAQNSKLDDTAPKGGAGSLTAEEKAICKQLGTSHEDFIKARDGE